jgi:hypothetical protein
MNQRLRSFLVVAMVMALSFCHKPLHEPPVVALLEPANNALVPKVVRISALVATHDGISEARLYIDGELTLKQAGGSDSVLTFIWNASDMTPWSRHSIAVEVTDNDNRTGSSDSVSVVIAATSGPTSHNGTITQDETWYAAGSPHIVGPNVNVEAVLTIEPGSVVEFQRGGGLMVGNGALIAQGGSSMITFTGQDTTPGFWRSIEFSTKARPDRSVLDNCLVEYGGGSGAKANVVVNAPVRISNCIFRRSARTGLAIGPMLVSSIRDGNQFSDNNPNTITITGNYITTDTHWDNHGVPYLVEDWMDVEGGNQTATLTIGPGTTLLLGEGAGIEVDEQGAMVADGSSGMITFTSEGPDDVWGDIDLYGDGTPVVQGVFKNCLIQNAGDNYNSAFFMDATVIEMENSVISNAIGYGMDCEDGSYFEGFRDNVITGCDDKPLVFDQEFVPTIGDGNSFTGNDIGGSCHDGILLYSLWDGIVTSATWPNLGVPYIIEEEDIELWDQTGTPPILTLAPGVRLEFDGTSLYVYDGALVADGTSGRITFTGSPIDEGFPGVLYWGGIGFHSTPDVTPQSILRNCLIEYGGMLGGDIICDSCAPVIEGNEISGSSQFGILLRHSSLNPDTLLAQNRFHDNDSGDVAVRPHFIIPPPPQKARSVSPHNPRRHEFRNHPPGPYLRREFSEAASSARARLRAGAASRPVRRPGARRAGLTR